MPNAWAYATPSVEAPRISALDAPDERGASVGRGPQAYGSAGLLAYGPIRYGPAGVRAYGTVQFTCTLPYFWVGPKGRMVGVPAKAHERSR